MHKSQSLTVNRTHVLASQYFDRHVTYIALSRHREQVNVYWSHDQFQDVNTVNRTLSRERLKDFTLDYASLRGINKPLTENQLPGWAKPHEAKINKLAKRFGKDVSFSLNDGGTGIHRGITKLGEYYFGIMEQDKQTKLVPYDKCRFIDIGEKFTLYAVKSYLGKFVLEAKAMTRTQDRGGLELDR